MKECARDARRKMVTRMEMLVTKAEREPGLTRSGVWDM